METVFIRLSTALTLNVQLGASPMAALTVITDSVISAKAHPVRNGTVLFHLLA